MRRHSPFRLNAPPPMAQPMVVPVAASTAGTPAETTVPMVQGVSRRRQRRVRWEIRRLERVRHHSVLLSVSLCISLCLSVSLSVSVCVSQCLSSVFESKPYLKILYDYQGSIKFSHYSLYFRFKPRVLICARVCTGTSLCVCVLVLVYCVLLSSFQVALHALPPAARWVRYVSRCGLPS